MVGVTYVIEVVKKMGSNEIVVAEIHAPWQPEDPERFAWELGGDFIRIREDKPELKEPH